MYFDRVCIYIPKKKKKKIIHKKIQKQNVNQGNWRKRN